LSRNTHLRLAIVVCFAFQVAIGIIGPVYAGTTGIISGVIQDSAAGEKLAGVNVIVEGTNLTTVTDQNGYYVITNVPPGEYKVSSSLVGYGDVMVENVSVVMDVTASVDFSLEQAVAEEEEVVVTEARPMIQRDVVPTMYLLDQDQEPAIRNQPHLLYQTPGAVATQPGIVSDADGYPHIRGGRMNQVGYMLDGIPITEPVTNGFGTNAATIGMDKMELFSGGYRPEYGNAISGVINQIIKTGRTAPGVSLEMVGGSQSYKGVYPELGGTLANGGDYYVGGYFWQTDFERLSYSSADSSDLVGKFTYPMGDKNKLTMVVANGSAMFEFPYTHIQTYGPDGLQPVAEESDHSHQSYLLNALTFNHTINSSSFLTLRPYYFRNRWKVDAISDDIGYWWDAESATAGLTFDYTNQLSQKHLVKAGAIRMSSNNRYWANVPALEAYGLGKYEYQANTDTTQTGLYIQDQMRFGSRWGLEAGLRYDAMKYDRMLNPDSTESQTSPRFGMSYAVNPRTNLRFSYGRMIQFVYTQAIERYYTDPDALWDDLYYGTGTGTLRPERCTQYDFGWERQVAHDYSLQITPFYRKYTDLLQTRLLDPDNPDFSPMVYDNLGVGTSKGVELMFRKRPSQNWSGWLSYTWSNARAESSNDREVVQPGVMQYVDWDQKHTAVLVANYMNKGWTYSMMGEYGSGLPYNLAGEPMNSRRVSSHAVVNLNVSREVKGGWLPEGEVRLGVANVFNVATVLDRGEDGDPIARVAPRFMSMSYVRRF
jgi:outer membrane receptor protein involved in Fe transport